MIVIESNDQYTAPLNGVLDYSSLNSKRSDCCSEADIDGKRKVRRKRSHSKDIGGRAGSLCYVFTVIVFCIITYE
jgi:hypothetical protein